MRRDSGGSRQQPPNIGRPLSDEDLRLIRRHRRPSTQLGFAGQLGYARYPGRVLHIGEDAHPQILAIVTNQLGVDPAAFGGDLQGRDTTCREPVLELQRNFDFRSFSATIYRELAGWLLPIALTTEVGTSWLARSSTSCRGVVTTARLMISGRGLEERELRGGQVAPF